MRTLPPPAGRARHRGLHRNLAALPPLALALACLVVGGCGDGSFRPGVPLEGIWGGDHVELTAAESGATLEYDCAAGVIDGGLVPDDAGRLDLTGTHTLEHGGPVQPGEEPDIHPARYLGRVSGRTLVLTVTLTDTDDVLGPYTLVLGERGRVTKCL